MPTFGEFETFGEPLSEQNRAGETWFIYQARRSRERNGATFSIKCYAAPRSSFAEGPGETIALASDRHLEFLQSVKDLKKAQKICPRLFAPVYGFDSTPEYAWYATDYYRDSLQSWIERKGLVDEAVLRHIVHNLATACLALQRSCGRSHGNLKASNVLLAGRTCPLRERSLRLVDPEPGPWIGGLAATGDAREKGEERALTEVADLRAIGQIVVQLVEGRILRSRHINFPVPTSAAWDRLGKNGPAWLRLCNQLLDPSQAPEIRLQELADQNAPGFFEGKQPLIIRTTLVLSVLAIGLWPASKWISKRMAANELRENTAPPATPAADPALDEDYLRELESARKHLAQRNPQEALRAADRADKVNGPTRDTISIRKEANKLLVETNAAERHSADALSNAAALFDKGEHQRAIAVAQSVLEINPSDAAARGIIERARRALEDEQRFNEALQKARSLRSQNDFTNALRQIETALLIRVRDTNALQLKAEIQKDIQREMLARESVSQTEMLLSRAQEFLSKTNYESARSEAQLVLQFGPNVKAQWIYDEAVKRQAAANHADALRLAEKFLAEGDYEKAFQHATNALANKRNDPIATNVREQARRGMAGLAEQKKNFKQAMVVAERDLNLKRYSLALEKVKEALRLQPDGVQEAQALEARIIHERDAALAKALEDAWKALALTNYEGTLSNASIALAIAERNADAAKLRNFATAMIQGLETLKANQFGSAEVLANVALDCIRDSPPALRLRDEAHAKYVDQQFSNLLNQASLNLNKQQLESALSNANKALTFKEKDPSALQLQRTIKTEIQVSKLLEDATLDLSEGEQKANDVALARAFKRAEEALKLKPRFQPAESIQTKVGELREKFRSDRAYEDEMRRARVAFHEQKLAEAIEHAKLALKERTNDFAALELKKNAEAGQSSFSPTNYVAINPGSSVAPPRAGSSSGAGPRATGGSEVQPGNLENSEQKPAGAPRVIIPEPNDGVTAELVDRQVLIWEMKLGILPVDPTILENRSPIRKISTVMRRSEKLDFQKGFRAAQEKYRDLNAFNSERKERLKALEDAVKYWRTQ